jgi:hypothetical protein
LDSTVKSVDPNVRRSSAVDVDGDGSSAVVVKSATAVRIEKGRELSEEDLKSLRIFMREMVVQSILPWIERSVVVGNEQVSSILLGHSFESKLTSIAVHCLETIHRWSPLQRWSQVLWRIQHELTSWITNICFGCTARIQHGQRIVRRLSSPSAQN